MSAGRPSTSSGHRSQTSSLFSESTYHKLHRVAFEGEDSAHWALLLPVKTGVAQGLFVHIGVQKVGIKPTNHQLRIETVDLTQTYAVEAVCIPEADVSPSELEAAAREVFQRKGYNMLTNNCQHFCIDVVTELHQRYPTRVTEKAIKDCKRKGTIPVKIRQFIHWTRFTKEGRDAYRKAKQAKAQQAEAAERAARPASRSSNRPRMSIN